MRRATSTFRGHPSSVPTARRWVVSTLAEWGLGHTGWSAAQVVSELATNCTLHARTDFTVGLAEEGGCVRVEARDESPAPLQARSYRATATTGRGLGIVAALATEWGVTASDGGKTVWALLPVEDADRERSGESRGVGRSREGGRRSSAPSGNVARVLHPPVAA